MRRSLPPVRFLVLLFACLCCCAAAAQSSRHTTHSNLFGVGTTTQQDSYLSPLDYHGTQFQYLHETLRKTHFRDSCVTFQTLLQAELSSADNDAQKASYLGGAVHYDVAWRHLLSGPSSAAEARSARRPFALHLGPQLGATLGALYNTRNGNNPAQAIAEIHLSASLLATYSFRLWRQPIALREQMDIPLLGAMFSPNYGQSYYELFTLGNYDHNICLTTPFSAPSLRNLLTIELPLPCCTLRFGYLADFRQSHVNDIHHHTYSHSFLLGWVRHLTIH